MTRTVILSAYLCAVVLLGCGDGTEKTAPPESKDSNSQATTSIPGQEKSETPVDDSASAALQSGVLAGRVRFEGKIPPPRTIQVTKDVEHCNAAAGEVQDVVVSDDGFLAGVVVEIQGVKPPESGWAWDDPEEGYAIRQKGCRFSPDVIVAHDGAKLTIYNDDPVPHNVNTGQWNVVQANGSAPIENSIRYAGQSFVRVTCNIHSWMETWVYVARSPYYATTGEDGRFRIEGLPPGKYRATVIHPTLGKQRLRVTIEPGQTVEQDVVFQSPESGKS